MTYKEIVDKAPCPTCGAARGTCCSVGAGRLRPEPHPERRTTAHGGVLGNILATLRSQMGSKGGK